MDWEETRKYSVETIFFCGSVLSFSVYVFLVFCGSVVGKGREKNWDGHNWGYMA